MLDKNFANVAAVPVQLAHPVVRTTSFNTDGISVEGYAGAEFFILYGVEGTGLAASRNISAKLQECDTLSGTYTDVAAADVLDSRTTAANSFGLVDADSELPAIYSIGYNGSMNFVRVAVTFAPTTHSIGTIIGILCVRLLPAIVGASRQVAP